MKRHIKSNVVVVIAWVTCTYIHLELLSWAVLLFTSEKIYVIFIIPLEKITPVKKKRFPTVYYKLINFGILHKYWTFSVNWLKKKQFLHSIFKWKSPDLKTE